ncbi:MAG: helix-turn-helix domain-containing protein [Solirubrobacterales bacterium]
MRSSLEIPNPSFGESTRFFRINAEMTQDEVAEKSGLHATHISEIEQGRGNPTRNTIEKLAKAIDVPIAYLYNLEAIYEWKRNRCKQG